MFHHWICIHPAIYSLIAHYIATDLLYISFLYKLWWLNQSVISTNEWIACNNHLSVLSSKPKEYQVEWHSNRTSTCLAISMDYGREKNLQLPASKANSLLSAIDYSNKKYRVLFIAHTVFSVVEEDRRRRIIKSDGLDFTRYSKVQFGKDRYKIVPYWMAKHNFDWTRRILEGRIKWAIMKRQ